MFSRGLRNTCGPCEIRTRLPSTQFAPLVELNQIIWQYHGPRGGHACDQLFLLCRRLKACSKGGIRHSFAEKGREGFPSVAAYHHSHTLRACRFRSPR